jgi:flagellin
MGIVINTNRFSLNAQASLRKSSKELELSSNRLSSGYKINSASEDAAGMTISERIKSDVLGFNKSIQNMNDGISVIQVTEGQLLAVQDGLQRVRELMVQAANGTYAPNELDTIQREINSWVSNIDAVARETNFNGVRLLRAEASDITSQEDKVIQSGITFDQVTNVEFEPGFVNVNNPAAPQYVSDRGINIDPSYISVPENASAATAAAEVLAGTAGSNYVDDKIEQIKDHLNAQGTNNRVAISAYLDTFKSGGAHQAENMGDLRQYLYEIFAGQPPTGPNAPVVRPAAIEDKEWEILKYNLHDGGQLVEDADTRGFSLGQLRVAGSTIDSYAGSNFDHGNLTDISNMIDNVSRMRSHLGAIQNSLQAKIDSQDTKRQNLQASRSRIVDADMALESSNMVKAQILQQSGVAMLQQANTIPQMLLDLLP